MSLAVRWKHTPAKLVVTVEGEIDTRTVVRLKESVTAAREAGEDLDLVVDLTKVTFLNSAGLAALVEIASQCHRDGQQLRLVCTTRVVLNPIRLTGLDRVFTIVDAP
ncbi:anti-sigma factor antagonist [Saccharothrix sp. AJ9571]|nr:anti-sigma factor antagonist [Saccharothrix sp. AJ9571]